MAERPVPSLARPIERRIDVPVAVATWLVAWVVGQVLTLVVLGVSGATAADDLTIVQLFIAVASTWVAYLVGMAVASRQVGTGSFTRDYTVVFRPVDVGGLGLGALAQLVLVPLVYLPLEQVWPDTFTDDRLTENAKKLTERATGWQVALLMLMVVLLAPVVEELVYRGLLQGAFGARFDRVLAWIVVAAWFTIIHFRSVEYPGLFAFALVTGACLMVTGRLGMSIFCHIGFNAVGLLMAR